MTSTAAWRRLAALLLSVAVVGVLDAGPAPAAAVRPLPLGVQADYQLGGDRSVPTGVGVVVRDRRSRPLAGVYNVCYVNAYQTQTDERRFWRHRMGLVLHRHGSPVVDDAWGEWLLDIRTPRKRARLAGIVGHWIRGCARDGFDAVELDNLDSFTRSQRMLTRWEAIRFARALVARAHRAGLAVAQKNLADLDGTRIGFDFAIAEECGRYHECARYVRHYGRRVLMVEYRRRDFAADCRHFGRSVAIELRDRALSPQGVRRWCR